MVEKIPVIKEVKLPLIRIFFKSKDWLILFISVSDKFNLLTKLSNTFKNFNSYLGNSEENELTLVIINTLTIFDIRTIHITIIPMAITPGIFLFVIKL